MYIMMTKSNLGIRFITKQSNYCWTVRFINTLEIFPIHEQSCGDVKEYIPLTTVTGPLISDSF